MRTLKIYRQFLELESVVENATHIFGKTLISEEACLNATQQLRATFPLEKLPDDFKSELFVPLDEIDQLLMRSAVLMGNRLISTKEFLRFTSQFRDELPLALAQIDDILKGRAITLDLHEHTVVEELAPLHYELELTARKNGVFLKKNTVNEASFLKITRQIRDIISPLPLNDEEKEQWLLPLDEMEKLVLTSSNFQGDRRVPEPRLTNLFSQFKYATGLLGLKVDSLRMQNSIKKVDYLDLIENSSRILDEVEKGENYAIVREGRIVATLNSPIESIISNY